MVGKEGAFLAEWPWERFGNYKYWIYAPFVLELLRSTYMGDLYQGDNWHFHILALVLARYVVQQAWNTVTRLHAFTKYYEIHAYAVGFDQVDREYHSDNHILLQSLFIASAHAWFPVWFRNLPRWSTEGLLWALLFHVGVTEPLYYLMHRAFHSYEALYRRYHAFHHLSVVPEPPTGFVTTMMEQVLQSLLVCVPIVGAAAMGSASVGLVFVYAVSYDFLKCWGHSNVEFMPSCIRNLPALKYLLYTPSYHSLHHTEQNSNFCLFMPLFDYLGGTVDPKTDALYAELRKGKSERSPEFVFLAHCMDVQSSLHISPALRTYAAHPYEPRWFIWPLGLPYMMLFPILWNFCSTFVLHKYHLDKLRCMAWVIPRHGFQTAILATSSPAHLRWMRSGEDEGLAVDDVRSPGVSYGDTDLKYFLPFGLEQINNHIEKAILDANEKGVKVLSLAALNKNEALNGGGMLFVRKHPNLRVRVVHGNTLTAGVIIKSLPSDVKEVFMNGATSKLGRVIALYLCSHGIRVLMLTLSNDRFESIRKEAPPEFKHNLVQVTKYQAGQNCKTWIVGKWTWKKDQQWAPSGTHFHQFVVPPIGEHRKDCTYGRLAGMKLPMEKVKGMRTCEISMERGAVHACHAGGLVHALEGWKHHEVGAIPVDRIDVVWEAAMKHGFRPIA